MKKYLSVLMAFFLCIGILLPVTASADSKTYYYVVEGTSKIAPGIYKGTINGNGKAVHKEKVYKMKELSKPPITMNKSFYFYGKGSAAKKSDYKDPDELITMPIQHVQAKGKDLYFTKFLFGAVYYESFCDEGGIVDILEIYKRDSKGNVSKVVNDKVTSNTSEAFVIKDNYIYYAKVNKDPLGKYDIVRATLDGKKKTTLKKSVDDFWINGKYIYFVSQKSLYRMDLKGKNAKKYSNLKVKLYGDRGCVTSNYSVSTNGLSVFDEKNIRYVFLDFSTGKTVNIPINDVLVVYDVDVKNKRYIALQYKSKKFTPGLYNFNGKLIKKSKVSFSESANINFISFDAKKREILYVDGTNLKKVKF